MFKKNLYLFLILVSLLFNVQAGFAHDIQHQYHDVNNEASHDCEDCTLKHQVLKSTLLFKASKFHLANEDKFFDNYQLKNLFSLSFVAYQSQAP